MTPPSPTDAFRAHSYWYRAPVKVRPGSFWFTTAEGPHAIESIDSQAVIPVDRAVVRLTPVQGEWGVFRGR